MNHQWSEISYTGNPSDELLREMAQWPLSSIVITVQDQESFVAEGELSIQT